jgi:hypothetical protein
VLALLEMVVPAWVIRWRAEIIATDKGVVAGTGAMFSRLTGTDSPHAWEDKRAQRNVRLFGLGLFLAMGLVARVLLLIFRVG